MKVLLEMFLNIHNEMFDKKVHIKCLDKIVCEMF